MIMMGRSKFPLSARPEMVDPAHAPSHPSAVWEPLGPVQKAARPQHRTRAEPTPDVD